MLLDFPCPACGEARWRRVGRYEYAVADLERATLTEYERLRLRVVFEVWFPDHDRVELAGVLCERCGFVTYTPRPDESDLDAKYRFLYREEDAPGEDALATTIDAERARAVRTFGALERHSPRRPGRVLDYGGAEGRLLVPFLEAGWSCALVDYVEQVLPGIERLGETIADLPAGSRFDAIVCSHVVEHLADPGGVLRALADHLAPGGALFVEVPLDLWRGLPIARDPVTHVNFLTPRTLEQLVARSGYRVLECEGLMSSYAGVRKEVVVVVATAGEGAVPDPTAAVRDAERRLDPTPAMRLSRLWRRARARLPAAF